MDKEWSTKTVKVDREVHDHLTSLKRGNMSYNDVIMMLLHVFDENKKK